MIVKVEVKRNGNTLDNVNGIQGRPFEMPYRDMIKEGGKLITWMPRGLASRLPDGANLISIEYFEDCRPIFEDDINLLSLISYSSGYYNKSEEEIMDWVRQCNDEPIFVHCEMGLKRSRHLAKQISDAYGYELCLKVMFTDYKGDVHQFIPHQF